jgi:diguanylate cyclase (GGDEF)-like protein
MGRDAQVEATQFQQLCSRLAARRPNSAVVGFSALLGLVALGGYLGFVRDLSPVPAPYRIPWIALAFAFAAADRLAIHAEVGDNAHTFTLTELPMVMGLYFCSPSGVVLARVVASLVMLLLVERQVFLKLVFNVALAGLETVFTVAAFGALRALLGPDVTAGWAAALLAVCGAMMLQTFAITTVIRLSGGRPQRGHGSRMVVFGIISAAATASLGISGVTLVEANPYGVVLIGVLAVVLFTAYRGYATIRQRYANLEKLYDFTKLLARTPELESAMRVTLRHACELLRADQAELCLVERGPDGERFVQMVLTADEQLEMTTGPAFRGDWARARVQAEQRAIVVPRTTRDEPARAYLAQRDLVDLAMAPLIQNGSVVGTLAVANRLGEVSTFDDDDLKIFETLTNHVSISLENTRLIDRLRNEVAEKEHQALHDPLTGLGNRNLFNLRADEALRSSRTAGWRVAVLLMDLNRFKEVNDTLGHGYGDLLLRQVATRLESSVPKTVTIARLGGDEFGVLIPQVRSASEAEQVAIRIQLALQQQFTVHELQLDVRAAIGIAVTPDHGEDPASLLQHADIAMYQAKENPDSGVQLYDHDQNRHSFRRLTLAGELKNAVDDESLAVYYQPKAEFSTGRIVGVEALLRWEHPDHGPVPPDEFVPLAENVGLMRPMTMLVLRRSLEQLAQWRAMGLTKLHVAVNLSAHSLTDLDLVDEIERMLSDQRLVAPALILEITETQMMADPSRTAVVLERLAAVGAQISIDDFGTGYSSLSYLHRLPVNEVKIDKSFVLTMISDDANAKIVRSIIDLGAKLNLRVVAEGVEDGITWDTLASLGCDIAQGFFLSRPIPAERLTPWMLQRQSLITLSR